MIHISYVSDGTRRYPCPVCCRHFARDYDLILAVSDEVGGKNIYICESGFWDEFPCDFSFPEGLSKEEIDEIAEEKIASLREGILRQAPQF